MRIKRYALKRFVGLILYVVILGSLYFVFTGLNSSNGNIGFQRYKLVNLAINGSEVFIKYKNLRKKDWHDYEMMKKEAARKGPGEQGMPLVVKVDDEDVKRVQKQLYLVNGYDAYVSDQIPLNRSVKDIRHKECRNVRYIEKLPSVSVIFPFHNEHNSTLLRSVYSVINRSPTDVLQEVILVDDGSTKKFLSKPLEKYWRDVGLSHLVKVVRTGKREGLIRARQVGARHALSDVIVFLDAHSEANYNWLPPLVEPIALDYRTVVCPFVDIIDCDTYEYRAQDEGARGSFDWEFNYKRLPLASADKKNPTKPFNSPVMAGGYFAISTKWFWELGGYDEGLDIWGGEQYELSFKVWQCHGKMIDAPCSRVGHIYRCKYVPFPNPGIGDFLSRNYKRVAEVWMDEYKEHLYKRKSAIRNADQGDLSKQLEIRQRLQCKSFDWFMKKVAFDQDEYYPAVEPEDSANGELRNVAAQKCIDTQFKGANKRFNLRKCMGDNRMEGSEQNMRMSFWEDIRPMTRNLCFDASSSKNRAPIILFECHGMRGNQLFQYRIESRQIYHPISNHCIDCDPEKEEIFLNPCENKPSQQWVWAHTNEVKIRERNAKRIN